MSWTRNRVRNNLLRNCALLYVGLLYFTDRSQLECVQHRVFLGCHPRTSMLLNFSDRTRTVLGIEIPITRLFMVIEDDIAIFRCIIIDRTYNLTFPFILYRVDFLHVLQSCIDYYER